MQLTKEAIADWFANLQLEICKELEEADGKANFTFDEWDRPGGGGGRSSIIENGNILEKGGVNFSAVHGEAPIQVLQALDLSEGNFFASGVSIVIHPTNPFVPIIHMNVRYFEMDNGIWWFGGGIDLTPHYIDFEDARYFHQQLFDICEKHDKTFYHKFKDWADTYFYIKHRDETRGVGGIFFDHLNDESTHLDKEKLFHFVQEVGKGFTPIYKHFMRKNSDIEYGEIEKDWQLIRRGRYVEYNLVYDRGTKFGLDTDGRTDSILMSLPPLVSWKYNYTPPLGSKEEVTQNWLKKDIDWIQI